MADQQQVTYSGTTSSGATTTTVLSGAQASQLIQKLQGLQPNGGGMIGNNQSIKIQTVQTNPSTGVRQIIAIPIQQGGATGVNVGGTVVSLANSSAATQHVMSGSPVVVGAGGSRVTISPMKAQRPLTTMSGLGPNVKVVKLAPGSLGAGGIVRQQVVTVSGAQVLNGQGHGVHTLTTSNAQVLTPSKQHVANYATPLLDGFGTGGGITVQQGGAGVGVAGAAANGSRKRNDIDFDAFSDAKRKKTEKGGKGLRHFSMKVCEKVQAKGSTSYNEVADELVSELTDPRCTSPTDQQYDQKNIRRRVYDALNVLMAMNIISKEKKEIRWLGLPTNSVQEANNLEADKTKRIDRIKAKTQQLQDLILQQIAFKNLVERNKEREKVEGPPAPNSAIQLPFIIVNTSKKTVIDCSISNDKMEYLFNFDDTFEIHDDMEVLKRMGLGFGLERGEVSTEDLAKARQMVPRALEQYVTQLAEKGPGTLASGMPKVSDPVALSYEVTAKSEDDLLDV